ncbi:hypothetical protein BAE44_0003903 [Dichanthelium oligosanthes]|uniref:Uncharacterized protein n=1 Tax=Dichanthelium oligosanthes TaxID=888268 RepID=A0A1E5WCX0_9POAL|nr:hypothetical protein BAE44_0003903 [Dichanthelium oligosanthes]
MAGVHQLPLQQREETAGTLALLGASVVVFSVVGNPPPPINAWCALAGFLVWLLGVARLLLLGQVGPRPLLTGALVAAADAANLAAGKLKSFLLGGGGPEPATTPV